ARASSRGAPPRDDARHTPRPATGRPQDADKLAPPHIEVQPIIDGLFAEDDADILECDDRVGSHASAGRQFSCHGRSDPSSDEVILAPGAAIRYDRCRDGRPQPGQSRSTRGRKTMPAVNAGARLDRLPISSFHYRIFWLVGAGMFFDGYDLYVGTSVLPALLQSKFSTLPLNAQFVSFTFFGMTIGALVTGFLGDRYGRRFTYQFNLMIFGLASLAAAFAPDMTTLNLLRFVMG